MEEDTGSGLEASALSGEGYQETGIQDTAGKPETKEELRGAKEYAEMIVDTVRDGLLVLDLDLQVMSANQSFYDSFDVDPEETVGCKVYDLMGGQWDIPELRRLLEEILPQDKVFDDYKVEHDFEGIGRRVMLLNARQLNEHELILLAIEDVTDRQQTQHELRESEERYRLLVESAEEYAIFMMDPEGRIATWSRGAENIFGYTEEEALGQPGAVIFTEEDRAENAPEQEMEAAAEEGQAADERWHVRKGGERFWGSGVMTALHDPKGDPSGDLRGFAKVMRDNTERRKAEEALRESEERYRLLLGSVEEYAIILMDAEGRIATWNAGARDIFGYEEEEVLGQRAAMLYTPEDRKTGLFDEKLQQARREGRAAHEHQLARRDGSRFWGTGIMIPMHTQEGELRFAKVVRDNTERREREEQIRQLNETLEERVEKRTHEVRRLASQLTMAEQRERRRIADVLHDDLQQLLYGAEMTTRRLRRELPEQGTALTADTLEERTAMLDQIEEVLDEAVQATRNLSKELSPPELQSDDLAGTLRWLADHMEERFDLSVELRLGDLPPMESPNLHTLVFRMLRELLFNVVKHAEVDRSRLEARAEDGRLRLKVEDEGVGFDPARLEEGQEGLGLSDMREHLEVLKGRLEVESAPGEGTRVRITLPDAFGEEV